MGCSKLGGGVALTSFEDIEEERVASVWKRLCWTVATREGSDDALLGFD